MRKAEKVLIVMCVLSISMSLFLIPGGNVMAIMFLGTLAMFYMYGGLALFNELSLPELFYKSSYKSVSALRIIGSILSGIALAIVIIGILFKLLSWPGASVSLIAGIGASVIGLLTAGFRYYTTKAAFYNNVFIRLGCMSAVGLLFLLLPKDSVLDFKYRNNPEILEEIKNRRNPSQEFIQKETE